MAWTTPTDRTTGYVVSAADWNIVEDDLTFLYGDAAWTAVTVFTNSWVALGGVSFAPGYRLDGVHVELRGAIKTGTIGTAAFTLPVGYRPTATCNFAVNSNAAYGQLIVSSAGVVTPTTGSNVGFSLDGVRFSTLA